MQRRIFSFLGSDFFFDGRWLFSVSEPNPGGRRYSEVVPTIREQGPRVLCPLVWSLSVLRPGRARSARPQRSAGDQAIRKTKRACVTDVYMCDIRDFNRQRGERNIATTRNDVLKTPWGERHNHVAPSKKASSKKMVLCSTDVFVRGKERLREGLKVDEATWAYVANLRGCVHRLLWFATSRATEPRHRREAP